MGTTSRQPRRRRRRDSAKVAGVPSLATHLGSGATSKRRSRAPRLRTLTRPRHPLPQPIEMCSSTASAALEPMKVMTRGSSTTSAGPVTTTNALRGTRSSYCLNPSQPTTASLARPITTGPQKSIWNPLAPPPSLRGREVSPPAPVLEN